MTWGNGSTGITGPVTAANSLVGALANDQVGNAGVTPQSDGNYILRSTSWDNPSPVTVDAGAVTLGDGATGTPGFISPANSVTGTFASGGNNIVFSYDPVLKQVIVGRKDSNLVSIFSRKLRTLAKTNLDAPGALDIAYSTPGTTAVNAEGGLLADFTLIGTGSAGGKNKAMFSATRTGPLDLVMRTGDPLSAAILPVDTKVASLLAQVTQQPGRNLFQATISGTGVTTSNNRLLILDNGINNFLLHRTGTLVPALGNASIGSLVEVLQSHDRDLIAINYMLKTSTTPSVTTSNDTGLMFINHSATPYSNFLAREGASVFGGPPGSVFGQFTGRAVAGQGPNIHFLAGMKTGATTVATVFSTTEDGVITPIVAKVGDNAFGIQLPGDGPAKFASFPALTQHSVNALFKATLSACPAAANEALFLGNFTRLMRKGDDVNAATLPGVKFGSLTRFWPAGPDQIIVQCTLTGTGVTSSNNQALILRQIDGNHLVLLRTGTLAPGCGPAKVSAISAVDVNPVSGKYVVLGTLSGALTTNNQALWTGNPALGDDTTQQILRQPVLRLRKGQIYSTASTPQSLVRSLTIKPAVDASGAGGRGLAQCIGASGDVAVYVLGDRSLTELVMLPP